jgi:peptidoglycan hydrolase-like protein with peptidoglycan-binding domain
MQPIELNGWNTWRLLGRRDPAPAYPIPDQRRTLKLGDTGQDVRIAQHIMATKAGQPIQPDGQFGLRTREAVENVQRFFRLTVNGTVDSPTWAVLDWLNAQ